MATNLVEWMLAHKTVAEAKVYVLAHLRAVQEGENPRGQRLQGEQAIGREDLPDNEETDVGEGDDDAGVAGEIACIPLNGQPATPSAVWEAAKAQLRFQMVHRAYDNWIADTRCIGVEDDPDGVATGQTLVVQVANPYAVQWLDLRLKRLILPMLQGLVGGPIAVRFQADAGSYPVDDRPAGLAGPMQKL